MGTGEPASIVASAKSLIVGNTKTNLPPRKIIEGWSTVEKGMALAMDGRLYITGNDGTQDIEQDDILVVIDKPNEAAFNAQIRFVEFPFGDGKTSVGLPNFIQSYFDGLGSSSVCTEESALSLYPNPTVDNVTVSFMDGCRLGGTIKVVNALGQVVLDGTERFSRSTEIDLSKLFQWRVFFNYQHGSRRNFGKKARQTVIKRG